MSATEAQRPTSGALRHGDTPGGGGTVLDVPFLPQSELLCGGAAATMVLRFWGATGVFPEDFQPLVRPEEGGIRTADLTAEVRSLGWDAVPFRGDPETVRTQIHQGRPVVALIEVGPDRYHFVVIVAWTDGEVVFHDPAESPFQRLPEQTFLSAWRPTNQWALRILPADDGATTRAPEAPERRNPRPRRSEEASRSGSPVSPEPTTGTETESSGSLSDVCAPLLETALDHVREGRPGLAEGRLLEAVERCPDSGRVRAELAGVHARMEAWEEAERAAESAVELAPSSDYAWQILATARYLTGDRTRALAAWNRIGEPR
ncbi:MAG: C39 family peptidase, partial [Thermoanaerobaculia bacterium]|nr:C39 family peptidase [Thermoanaerobaculia bacterium]